MSRRDWSAVDFTADILDARDLVARFDYCDGLHDDLEEAVEEAREEAREAAKAAELSENSTEIDEANAALDAAEKALSEFEGGETEEGCDWAELKGVEDEINEAAANGNEFIAESYFKDYVNDLVVGIGDIPKDLPDYIADNIDWAGVASDLKADYCEVEMSGVTWLYRS